MENIGVAVSIIINDKVSKITTMQDDGTGAGIRIPSMMISNSNGQILLDWLKSASK